MLIKFCGARSPADAEIAMSVGAWAIGLNFLRHSPRCVSMTIAEDIARTVGGRTHLVGLFAADDWPLAEPSAEALGCSYVQLYGLAARAGAALNRARANVSSPFWRELRPFQAAPETSLSIGSYWLFDGPRPGSGTRADWANARQLSSRAPVILAGGLTPDNVSAAIREVRPLGVDVASGVENSAGRLDAKRAAAFAANARAASEEVAHVG